MAQSIGTVEERLDYLELQIKRMVAKYEELNLRYQGALADVKEQKEIIDKQKVKIVDFQSKVKFNNIVTARAGEAVDFEALKQKIDAYIGEIDKTIQYLNE